LLPWQSHPPTHRSTRDTILQQSISPQRICKSPVSLASSIYQCWAALSFF
jgi:hypothetical protein